MIRLLGEGKNYEGFVCCHLYDISVNKHISSSLLSIFIPLDLPTKKLSEIPISSVLKRVTIIWIKTPTETRFCYFFSSSLLIEENGKRNRTHL